MLKRLICATMAVATVTTIGGAVEPDLNRLMADEDFAKSHINNSLKQAQRDYAQTQKDNEMLLNMGTPFKGNGSPFGGGAVITPKGSVPMDQQNVNPISNKKVTAITGAPVTTSKTDSGTIKNEDKYTENQLYAFPDKVTGTANLNQPATPIMQGKANKPASVAPILVNKKTKEEINKALDEKEDMEKFLARRGNDDVSYTNRSIYYNFKEYEQTPIEIYIKKGHATQIEFVNEIEDPIRITQILAGSQNFNLTQPASNILAIEPTAIYRSTNLNLRLNGYNGVVTFKVIESKEGYETTFDNYLKLVVTESTSKTAKSISGFKLNVLQELFKYGTLRGGNVTEVPYDVTDSSKNATAVRYFDSNDLKLFRVTKFGRDMLVVQLSNKYEVLGYGGADFARYSNTFDVYFLPFTTGIFEIIKKSDIQHDPNSTPDVFDPNIGLGEIYKIELK